MIAWVLLCLSLLLHCVAVFVIMRLSRRLLQFDELFELLARDVDVNIRFFQKLLATPLFDNSQEVKTANHNMGIISKRLDEFVNKMEEATNRKLREKEVPNPPVVR